MSIEETLKKNRPNLSDSSLRTYMSILKSIHRGITGSIGEIPVKFFIDNFDNVIKYLDKIPYNSRKTKLASLVALCGDDKCAEEYRKRMTEDIREYNLQNRKQEMNEKQKRNWISQEELTKIYNELKKDSLHLLKKDNLSNEEKKRLQNFITISLYTLTPPRRLLDYTLMKIKNYTDKDNYINKGKFFFNTYKTSKNYHTQIIPIDKKLLDILKKYINHSDNDYLLYSVKNGKPLSPSQLTLRLNKIFKRNASVNILRHSYITEYHKNMKPLEEMDELAKDMGNSIDSQLLYIKNNKDK